MKALPIFILILFHSHLLNAQKLKYGLEMGLNRSVIAINEYRFQSSLEDSYHIGVITSYNFLENFGLQSGVLYMRHTYDEVKKGRVAYHIFERNNLMVPLDLIYTTSFGLSIGLGIYGTHNLTHPQNRFPDCTQGNPEITLPVYINSTTFGTRYSIGMNFINKKALDLGFYIKYYRESKTTLDLWTSVNANLTSVSLLVNYKGKPRTNL